MGSLRQAAKCLTIMLAGYLADFVAETLRAALRSQGAPLTDEENIHLLGANYWVQPIYQELLHVASGHNASVQGERKRPCSGLVKVMANQKHIKTRVPDDNTACVSDWIGGFCPADSLMVWFPAHWAPQVLKELERREQDHRARFPQWFEQRVPYKFWQQQQDACASRTLQFQKRHYLESSIELLSASIRVDRFSLPVQSFLDRLPHLRQCLIRGVFLAKASSPWCGNKSERLQVSMCLPKVLSLGGWHLAKFCFSRPHLMPRIVVDSGTGLQLRELKLRRGAKGRVEDLGAICFWPIKTDSVHLYTYLFCCGTGAFAVGVILVLWLLLW